MPKVGLIFKFQTINRGLETRPTANNMGPQKYKNETQKMSISAAILSVFSFVYVPCYGLGE